MIDVVTAVAAAFGVVFLAELGDKTQLLALGFGARYPLRVVIVGLALGFGAAGALASIVGAVLGATLPERPIAIAAGVLFIGFAIATLRDGDEDPHAGSSSTTRTRGAVASIAFTIALAEMGDKTQLATAALAARNHPLGTWIGATAGTVCAATIGAFAGRSIGTRVSERSIRYASAAIFAGFGIALLLTA